MKSSFRKIKRIIPVFLILAITAFQLVSCAAPAGQEGLNGTDQAPDASAKDVNQQTTETGSISGQEKQELSGDALLEYFQTVYDIHLKTHTATTAAGLIQEELDFLVSFVESDGEKLPSDYEAQYRAWRPETLPADIQTQQNQQGQEQQNHQQSGGQQAAQSQAGQASSQQTQDQQQQQTSNSSSSDLYRGYGSYEAWIDSICQKHPEDSREEIMSKFPDPAGIHVDEEAAQQWAQEGLLNNGG